MPRPYGKRLSLKRLLLSALLAGVELVYELVAEARCLPLEPDAVVGRERAGVSLFARDQMIAVSRTDQGGNRDQRDHQGTEYTVLHGVAVLVAFQHGAVAGVLQKKDAEITAAPSLSELKIIAVAPFPRAASRQDEDEGYDTSDQRKR